MSEDWGSVSSGVVYFKVQRLTGTYWTTEATGLLSQAQALQRVEELRSVYGRDNEFRIGPA